MKFPILILAVAGGVTFWVWYSNRQPTEVPKSAEQAPPLAETESQKKIFAENPDLVFYIGRTLNPNIVLYEAVTEQQRPVDIKSCWLMLNEDGQKKGFGILDNSAYGHSIEAGPDGTTLQMRLTALSNQDIDRELTLQFDESLDRVVAQTMISGNEARLFHVWVEHGSTRGFLGLPKIPTVYHIDLHGFDPLGNHVTERIPVNPK